MNKVQKLKKKEINKMGIVQAREAKEKINTFAKAGMIKEEGYLKSGDLWIGYAVMFEKPIPIECPDGVDW